MNTYIVLLRGINVGGHKKIPMAPLRELLSEEDFSSVKTYIQSGNIILKSSEDKASVGSKIHDLINTNYGFEVPVLVLILEELGTIIDSNPFDKKIIPECYYVMPFNSYSEELKAELSKESYPNEHFEITEKCIYLYVEDKYGTSKCSNNFFERKLKITATARNHKTMLKLVSLAEEN